MKKMKLSIKLILCFFVVALITLSVGVIGWISVNRLSVDLSEVGEIRLPGVQNLLILKEVGETIRVAQRTLLNPELNLEDRDRQYKNIADSREKYEKAWKLYEAMAKTPKEDELWKQFVPAWNEWRAANNEFVKMSKELDASGILNPLRLVSDIRGFTRDHYKRMADVLLLISSGRQFEGGEDHEKCAFGKWISELKSSNQVISKVVSDASSSHSKFHKAIGDIKQSIKNNKPEEAKSTFASVLQPAAEDVFSRFGDMLAEAEKAEGLYSKMNIQSMKTAREKQIVAFGLLEKLIGVNSEKAAETRQEASKNVILSKTLVFAVMVAGFAVALGFGSFLGLSISRALSRVISGLSEGGSQVASAAGQIAGASQSLAEGASEQAASLEETTSSLEEMSAMTRKNAENAFQADSLMKETGQIVADASKSIAALTAAIEDVSVSSTQTQKIIRIIDEIAFQTNLLALNAAVEAARAGEAGAGFAVVAEEVRNLAVRSAEAAKNTASMIEDTVKKVNDGRTLLDRTNESFSAVAGSSARVGSIVSEISAASEEQAKGIELISKAMNEMGKVTQQNAANAEESASASEELSAQSEHMLDCVNQLVAIVGGGGSSDHSHDKVRPMIGHRARPGIDSKTAGYIGNPSSRKRISGTQYGRKLPAKNMNYDQDDFGEF